MGFITSSCRDNDYWEVYTLVGCPYCDKAKKLLEKHHKKFKSVVGAGNPVIEREIIMKGAPRDYHYWPKIFHNGIFIGGYSDLEKILGK